MLTLHATLFIHTFILFDPYCHEALERERRRTLFCVLLTVTDLCNKAVKEHRVYNIIFIFFFFIFLYCIYSTVIFLQICRIFFFTIARSPAIIILFNDDDE